MIRTQALVTTLLGICVVTACAGDEQSQVAPPVLRDSAGISIVTSTHPLEPDTVGWSVSSRPVLEVGTRADLVVHWIRGAVRLSDGRIAIISESAKQIHFLSEEGDLIESVGGEGDGPGEFRGPFWLKRATGDTLIVTDRRSNRISWFRPDGQFIRQELPPREQLQAVVPEDQSAGMGLLVSPGYYVASTTARGLPPPGGRIRRPVGFVLLGPEGDLKYLGGFLGWEYFHEKDNYTGRWAFFANKTILATGGDPAHLYIGETDPFEVQVFDLGANLVRIIRDEVPPSPITDRDIEWERWELLDWGEQSGQLEKFARHADAMPIPDEKPAFEELLIDAGGYLWAKEYTSYKPELALYRVYDPEGRRVGGVYLPGRLQVFDIGRDYVLGVEWDLDYVETVQMYSLVRPGQ